MQYIAFFIALMIVVGIGLWSRGLKQNKMVKKKTKVEDEYLKQHRRSHLRRVK